MWRMLGSIFRFAVHVIWGMAVSISIVLTVTVALLWWHSRVIYQDLLEVTAGKTYTRLISKEGGLELLHVRRWPWPLSTEVRFCSSADRSETQIYEFNSVGDRLLARQAGLFEARSGRSQAYMTQSGDPTDNFDDGNLPLRAGHGDAVVPDELLQNGDNWSIALPVVTVRGVPFWLAICACGVPIPFQVVLLARRLVKGRRSAVQC